MPHSNFNSISTTLILIPLQPISNLITHVFQKVLVNSVVSDSLQNHRQQPSRLLCPRNSPGKDTGVGCHSLLQGIFLTQGSNPGLLQCRRVLYPLNQGSHMLFKSLPIDSPLAQFLKPSYSHWINKSGVFFFFLKIFAIYQENIKKKINSTSWKIV